MPRGSAGSLLPVLLTEKGEAIPSSATRRARVEMIENQNGSATVNSLPRAVDAATRCRGRGPPLRRGGPRHRVI